MSASNSPQSPSKRSRLSSFSEEEIKKDVIISDPNFFEELFTLHVISDEEDVYCYTMVINRHHLKIFDQLVSFCKFYNHSIEDFIHIFNPNSKVENINLLSDEDQKSSRFKFSSQLIKFRNTIGEESFNKYLIESKPLSWEIIHDNPFEKQAPSYCAIRQIRTLFQK